MAWAIRAEAVKEFQEEGREAALPKIGYGATFQSRLEDFALSGMFG